MFRTPFAITFPAAVALEDLAAERAGEPGGSRS